MKSFVGFVMFWFKKMLKFEKKMISLTLHKVALEFSEKMFFLIQIFILF